MAETEKRQFPCGQCGAGMEFDPEATALTCPYCEHVNELPKSEEDIEELDFESYIQSAVDSEDLEERSFVRCDSCGAEVTFDPNITSDECPFCASAIVAAQSSKKFLKPRSLLPFRVTQKEAFEQWKTWLHGLWFAPSNLKKRALHHESLQGIYVPYWTYDSDTLSYYRGQRGDNYTVSETYTTTENGNSVTKTRQVTKIRWRPASGRVWKSFDDVLVLASRTLPRKITDKLEPWDLGNLSPYSDEFLSGFRSESYQVDLAAGFQEARKIMDKAIRRSVCRDIGGDHQRIHTVKTRHDDVTFKHILLPIWISAYRYSTKVYRFLVNARTGEVQGERPWSYVKIAFCVLGALGIIGTIAAIASR